jgi:hypothetical protein
MPLNQKQRDQITPYLEHFFYGLSSSTPAALSGLKSAIEKSLTPVVPEQKEAEEKLTDAEREFSDLTHLINAPQEKIKKVKVYNDGEKKVDTHINFEALNVELTTVDDVVEYIIFYSLCCVQFHLQNSEDDFNINTWLLEQGITQAELDVTWQPSDWLKKIGTEKALAAHNWDINTTLTLINQHKKNAPYVTQLSALDYGSGGLDWTISPLQGRTYRAEIHPETRNRTDKEGKVLEVSATLDLHVDVYISPEKTLTKIITDFTPYPNVPARLNETDAERRTRDLQNGNLQHIAKDYAEYLGESCAISEMLNYLKKTGITSPPKSATLADLFLAESAAQLTVADKDAQIDLLPSLSDSAVSSHSDSEFKAESESSLNSSEVENSVSSESDSESEEEMDADDVAPWVIDESISVEVSGMRLLTYQFYFDEFKRGRLSMETLVNLEADETDTLCNPAIRSLIEYKILTIDESLEVAYHVIILLKESPHYLAYICQNPEVLQSLKLISPEQAKFLRLPITNNLVLQDKMLFQTALLVPSLAFPIFSNLAYANYLNQHPEAIPLLIKLTQAQANFLLNEVLSNMIEREILTLATALRLPPTYLPIITHDIYTPIFIKNKKAFSLLLGFTEEKIKLLLDPQILDLIKSGILPAEKALSYTVDQLSSHTRKNTLILLRRKKVSSNIVSQFNSTHSQIIETEPYATLLREHTGPKPHILFSASKENLERLLYPTVKNLILARVITVEDMIFATPKFLNIFFGNAIQMLLIEKKITSKQIKKLTISTANKIEQEIEIYKHLASGEKNDGSKHYIPLKVWSKELTDELIKTYKTERHSSEKSHSHTSQRVKLIADGEKISEDVLRAEVIKLFLKYLSEEITSKKSKNSPESIAAIYNTILETITTTLQAKEPNWTETFVMIAMQAHQTLNVASSAQFQIKLHPRALGLFGAPSSIPQKDVAEFCERIIKVADFLQPAEITPKLENDAGLSLMNIS